MVFDTRHNGRGKRKKKTQFHREENVYIYLKYYHQTKKLTKLLDEKNGQIHSEQIAKRKAQKKVKASIEKTECGAIFTGYEERGTGIYQTINIGNAKASHKE
eukprot:651247_1